ncbi:MAG: DUF1893 domain-containing protein [Alistipes sp.]|nr:DUF1893 domain-containing protein [Alistipes sp.]
MTEVERRSTVGLLMAEGCSCVIRKGDTVRIFRRRGVADLLGVLHDGSDFMRGAFVADKVVGKGAAALMVLGGVEEVYADVVSLPALRMLEDAGIAVEARLQADNIINRRGDDICPVERLCMDCATAGECLPLIEAFVSGMQNER